jgi:hypothetical protein
MLAFLAVASNRAFVVESYEDNAVGQFEKNVNGKFAITRVELHPKTFFTAAASSRRRQISIGCTIRRTANALLPTR